MAERIFITGGCGFVGSYLVRALHARGKTMLLYDAFLNYVSPFVSDYQHFLKARMAGLLDQPNIRIERGDTRVQRRVIELMREFKPDVVVHLAALPSAKESTLYPTEALQINVDGTLAVLEAAKAAGSVKRVVFASSSFVYGNFKTQIADETHPTDPIDVYGGTKLTGEILTRSYAKAHGFEYVIVRPSAVYGFGDANRRVTQILIENAIKRLPLMLHDGGQSFIDFTYVTDLADGLTRCIEHPAAANETFNLTRGNARTVREFALEVRRHFPQLELVDRPPDALRPQRGTLSIEKACNLLDYHPQIEIEQGVALYAKDLRERGPRC